MLLPTVRSRCQKVTIARPSREQAIAWLREKSGHAIDPALLEFAGGAPLRALSYADGRFDALNEHMQKSLGALLAGQADVTQVAAEWEKDGSARAADLARPVAHLAGARGTCGKCRPDHVPRPALRTCQVLPRTLNISGVYSMVDRARALKAQLARTALQRELAVESWLIALLDVLAPASHARQ